MQTLVFTIIGIWLLNAVFEVTFGLVQIIFGLTSGCLGLCLWGLSFLIECLEALWRTAFSTSD